MDHSSNNNLTEWLSEIADIKQEEVVVDSKSSKKLQLDLFNIVIPAMESGNKKFYESLSQEEQDSLEFWMLMRWATSSAKDNEQILRLYTVNQYVNLHFKNFTSKKTLGIEGHRQLLWQLLTIACRGSRHRYKLIVPGKRSGASRLHEYISEANPNLRDEEINTLIKINTDSEILDWMMSRGLSDKEINEILNQHKDAK